jgi:formamidopyrimidine-DNA glycosylase
VAAGGSTLMDYRRADGSEGLFQLRHRVYGREGRSCTRCRSKIERIVVAGRSTFICPRCQRITRQSARGAATQ